MKPNWRKNYLRYKSYFLNVVANYNKKGELKVYLELILSLLTISIFSVFALRPTLLVIGNLVKEIQVKKETITQLDSKIQQLDQAQLEFNKYKNEIDLLGIAVPEEAQPEIFSRQVEALSAKHNITKTTMQIDQITLKGKVTLNPKAAKNIATLPDNAKGFTFTITSEVPIENYSYLTDFLKELENLRTPIRFDNIQISASTKITQNTNGEQVPGIGGQQKVTVLNMTAQGEVPFYSNTN